MSVTIPIIGIAAWIAGALGVGGGVGAWIEHHFKRDLAGVPALLHFHGSNLTATEVKMLHHMTIEPHDDGTALFRNHHLLAEGNITKAGYGNGVAHGALTISMTRDGQEPFVEHGKWIVVDTNDSSEADNETIANFNKLMTAFGAEGEMETVRLLEMLSGATDRVANDVKTGIRDPEYLD